MTQSNDGTGGKPGSAGHRLEQRPAPIAAGKPVELPMLPAPGAAASMARPPVVAVEPAADTEDMQDLLRKIADQIAEAEQRQEATLDGVRTRLDGLAKQTVAAKAQAPAALQTGLGSIEDRIATMAETVETASREIKSGEPMAPASAAPAPAAGRLATGPAAAGPATPANMHVRGFGRGQVRGSNDAAPNDRPAANPQALTVSTSVPAPENDTTGPWDQDSADALAHVLSDEEPGTSINPTPGKPTAPGRALPDANRPLRPEPPALASASLTAEKPATSGPALPPPGATASANPVSLAAPAARLAPTPPPVRPGANVPPTYASAPKPPPPALATPPVAARGPVTGLSGPDRDWMTARFAEIAGQVERSLKENRPERALSALGQRFDKFESSLASVVGSVRGAGEGSGGHVALQALDQQVSGLKSQVDVVVQRLGGLDAIKSDVAALSLKLGALDRLEMAQTQVAAVLSGTRSDIDHLTRAVTEQKPAGGALGLSGGAALSDARLDTIHQMVETQAHERREGEAATVAVLQAIQGAIDQLTGRLEQFEDAVATTVLSSQEQSAQHYVPAPSRPEPSALLQPHEHPARRPATEQPRAGVAPEPELEPVPQAIPRNRSSRGQTAAVAVPEASIPRTRRGLGNIAAPGSANASPRSALAADEMPEPARGARRGTVEPDSSGHENMLDAARRSAARSAPADEDDVDPADDTVAARLPGQKRVKAKAARGGFFTFEKAGSRPIHVVMFVALLAAGAGMLYGTLAERPQPMQIDKPKAPIGKVSSVQQPRETLSRTDVRTRVGDAVAVADAATDRRLPAGGETQRFTDDADDIDMRAADRREAALSALKPAADADPAPLHTSSSSPPVPGGSTSLTTGILVDSGAPMPSPRDLKRYSDEQRMARISSQLGDRAVQKTEIERTWPASHTPDAVNPDVQPVVAPGVMAPSMNAGGLPPAQIGPMSLRVAAAKGDPSAEFEVASRFAQGKGVPKDFAKAAEWYQRAASRGSAPAQYRLGGLYERGIGIKADPARARAWYRRAADLGNIKAMHNLAVLHAQRDGGEPDYAAAGQWFTKAANHGLSDSQFNLAILYENGMGVPKSAPDAYKWYALAAERGDPEAAKRRDAIAARTNAADVERVRMAIAKWRPQSTDPAANDPLMAGQAWRNRHGEESSGGADTGQILRTAPAAVSAKPAAAPRAAAQPEESEILDLSSAAIDARMRSESTSLLSSPSPIQQMTSPMAPTSASATPASASAADQQQAMINKKRRVVKVQNPADVEKMLAQYGYNPSALKKARPEETGLQAPKPE